MQKKTDRSCPLRSVVSASKPVSRVLSFKTAIYLDAPLPVRSSRLPGTAGPAYVSLHGVAPDRVYSDGLFPAIGRALTSAFPSLPLPTKTQFSQCPQKGGGGISLLHFSWGRPRRVLPVILALWSPDFPHPRAFRPAGAAVQLACPTILRYLCRIVKSKAVSVCIFSSGGI